MHSSLALFTGCELRRHQTREQDPERWCIADAPQTPQGRPELAIRRTCCRRSPSFAVVVADLQCISRHAIPAWNQRARTIDRPIDNRKAITRITPLKFARNMTLVGVEIETGRKHQIRKHLAQIGFPIVGDKKYGSGIGENLQLVSVFLEFINPETKRGVSFELPKQQHLKL